MAACSSSANSSADGGVGGAAGTQTPPTLAEEPLIADGCLEVTEGQIPLGVWPLAVAHDPVVGPTLMPRLGTLIGLSRLFKKKKKENLTGVRGRGKGVCGHNT